MAQSQINLYLDSGAFSAWKTGKSIDVDEYIKYIHDHKHLVKYYVNLDTLPGKPGVKLNQKSVDDAAAKSYETQQYMKSKGLTPIPVFHQGEKLLWLYKYLEDEEPYIGISPSADLSTNQIRPWLDQIFTILTDRDGWPSVKTHGFGVASFEMLKRYPWYSCDATSWALTAAYGRILVPVYRNGKPAYDEEPIKLTVSNQGKKDGTLSPDHYLRMGPIMKQRVEHFLETEADVRVAEAAESYEARMKAIVFFFLKFEAAIGEQPFRYRQRGFAA